MTIEEALRSGLLSIDAVELFFGQHVYIGHLPQKPSYPAITYEVIATVGSEAHSGDSNFCSSLVTVMLYGTRVEELTYLRDSILSAWVGYRGSMGGASGRTIEGIHEEDHETSWDDDLNVWTVTLTFNVEYLRPV